MKQIIEFEVIDHGVNHSQYFQGCGVAFTKYDDCITGIGMASASEAFEDCLEQLSQSGYEITSDLEDAGADLSDNDDVTQSYTDSGEEVPEDSELYYYVSIRIKAKQSA